MASTYTTNGGIELIGIGEQSGTWGTTTNTNLQIIDRLTNGVGTISLSGTTHTLTTSDGTLSDGQYSVLVFGGAPSGTNTVTISPNDAQHVYIVRNTTAQSVVLTQGSGGNVTVTSGKSAIVYANGAGAGAAVVDVTNTFNFQPLDAELTAIAALATTDGNFIVGNGSTWVAESGSTARSSLGLGTIATQAANSVSITGGSITGITDLAVADGGTGASTAANARTNLGLAIGTNVQAWDVNLDQIAALAVTAGNFIVGNGSAWVAESGATARTSLGLGTIATQAANSVSITGGSITGITDLAVADGGTGASNAATARTNLGVAIGTDVLAYDANLQGFVTAFTLPTVDGTSGQALVTNGSGTISFGSAGISTGKAIAMAIVFG